MPCLAKEGPIGGSLEANPGPEVETESDLKGQGQRNGVEGQGRGIEDLGQRIENAQDLKTERIEKIEKGHAQEIEKDHGTEIGIDAGKTKAIETESQGLNLKVVRAIPQTGSMEREPSGLKMSHSTRKKSRNVWS